MKGLLEKLRSIEAELNQSKSSYTFQVSRHFGSPLVLAEFVAEAARAWQPQSIIDPLCGSGLLLAAASDAVENATVYGIDINDRAFEVARRLISGQAKLFQGDMFLANDGILHEYDLIIADPPLGMRLSNAVQEQLGLAANASFQDALLKWVGAKLSSSGRAVICCTAAEFGPKNFRRLKSLLSELDLRIEAALNMPGRFRQGHDIVTEVLVLTRGAQKKLFVGQMDSVDDHMQQLVSNYRKGKLTKNPAHGRYVEFEKFRGFESFVAADNLGRMVRKLGWQPIPMKTIFPNFERVPLNPGSEIARENESSIFLKLNGKFLSSTNLDDMRSGSSRNVREVVRLTVDQSVADASYLVHWFNESRVGRLTLKTFEMGLTIPRLNFEEMYASQLALPEISEQKQMVQGASKLRKIRAELDELEGELWGGSDRGEALLEQIYSVNKEDRYVDWIDTLPFPLASILYRHHAMGSGATKLRYEVLLHFFEATAAFLATLHLSAFMSRDEVWDEYGSALATKLKAESMSLERPSFGTWKFICEFLVGVGSKLRSEQGELVMQMYGTRNAKILDMCFDRSVYSAIQMANKIRNDWGHGGAVGNDQAQTTHLRLEDLVQQLRGAWKRSWQYYQLVEPGSSRYREGIHHTQVKLVMGTKLPFVEKEIESTAPLEDTGLYLFDLDERTGIKLLPFIKVMPSPDRQVLACFIYNRLSGADQDARWVSYHFDQESEIPYSASELTSTLESLRQ